ncbi:MAG: hypothetical protein U0872_00570 [Planctomycetaceae bacterium]
MWRWSGIPRCGSTGSSTAFRQTTTDDTTTIELPIDGAKELTVAWQPLQAKGAGAAVVHVESSLTTAIADNGVTLHVGLNYRVRQGTIQDFSLEFPAALKLQSLAGADLGGWEMQETPAGRKLRILLRRPVSDQTQAAVTLFLDQKISAEPVALNSGDCANGRHP